MHRVLTSLAVVVVAVVIAPAGASAASLPTDTTAVLSGTPDLSALLPAPVNESSASVQSVDRDGGRVAFASASDGLLAGDDDDVENVYVKDVATGAVTLASVRTDGQPSRVFCDEPVISDDGTHVAFECDGSLDPADPGTAEQIYERDLDAGTTTLVSRVSGLGAAADGDSNSPSIDATGAHVAFVTRATNLGDGAPATVVDRVYRRTIGAGDATALISRANGAAGAAAGADEPTIDNSGNRVAFDTDAPLDATADTNNTFDIYVRTVGANATDLVSRASGSAAGVANGAVGNKGSQSPAISGNGSFVAFTSLATNLDPTQSATATTDQIFRRSLSDNTTRLLSTKADGTQAHGDAFDPAVDDSGTIVSFLSDADNLDPAVPGAAPQAYVRTASPTTNRLVVASRRDGIAGAVSTLGFFRGNAISGDGTKVVIGAGLTTDSDPVFGGIVIRDIAAGTTRLMSRPAGTAPLVNAGGFNSGGSVSADGRFVVFISTAPALGAIGPVPGNVFVRDAATGDVTLVGRADGPDGAPIPAFASDPPQISADGRRVVFIGFPDASTPSEESREEVFVRDIPDGRTFIASRADGADGAISPGRGTEFHSLSIDADGSRVAFATDAPMTPGDPSTAFTIYVRDLDAGRTFLVSRPNGVMSGPLVANGGSEDPVISGDGQKVAFATRATNLADGDTNSTQDVHVRTIDTGVTELASSAPNGTRSDGESFAPALSGDGDIVSFASNATTLGAGAGLHLFVRNLKVNTLDVASRADGVGGGPVAVVVDSGHAPPLLNADGSIVAFVARADSPMAPGDPADGTPQLYERNLLTGVTRLISRRTGVAGDALPSPGRVFPRGITADGGCVTFETPHDLTGGHASTDFDQIYMRVLKPDCGRPQPVEPGGPGPGDSGSGGLPGGGAVDRTAPKLSSVRLSHTRFRVRRKASTLSLRVSEAATLTITVQRERPGTRVRAKGRSACHAVAKRPRRGGCVALTKDGTIRRSVKAGVVKVVLDGRVGSRRLAIGAHRLVLVARDAAGNVSRSVTVRFSIVR